MAREGYFKVPNGIITEHGRTLGAFGVAVFCSYAMHAGAKGKTFVKYGTIAQELSICRRTVIRATNKLIDLGFLANLGNQGRGANRFLVNGTANLWTAALAEKAAIPGPRGALESPLSVPGVTPGSALESPLISNKTSLTIPINNSTQVTIPWNADGLAGEPSAAAAVSLTQEQKTNRQALVERGLSGALADHYARTADPALIREILAYHQAGMAQWENSVKVLRSMLDQPEKKWGFERTLAGWKRPPPDRPACGRETPEQVQARTVRERQAHEQWRAESILEKGK
jgi:hypothetical protein